MPDGADARGDSLCPLMDAQVPAVVAVVVTTDAGPWFEETLSSLAAQDYGELSVLVLSAGDDDLRGDRAGRPHPARCVRPPPGGPARVRGRLQRGARHGRGRGLLLALPRRRRARPRCRPRTGGGVLPLQRRRRVPEVRQLGRPRHPLARRDELRQDRSGGGPHPRGRSRPRPARRRARRLRRPGRVHPRAGRPLQPAEGLRRRDRRHGGGPRPLVAQPGRRVTSGRGARRAGAPS